MDTFNDDDWIHKFTFIDDAKGDNFSLQDCSFEMSADEMSIVCALSLSDDNEHSLAATDSTGRSTSHVLFRLSDTAVEHKEEGSKEKAVAVKRKKGPVSKYRPARARSKIPNISRGKPAAMYVFPSFDKCDSLVYFPTAMARLSNSGDFDGFTKLIKTHFHKSCITTLRDFQLDRTNTLKVHEIHHLLCPDYIECVTDTKIIENTIEATMVAKFTESNFLYHTVRKQLEGSPFQAILCDTRSAYLRSAVFADAAVREEFLKSDLPDSEVDFTVDVNLHYKLTFEDTHRKVTKMEFAMIVRSIRPLTQTELEPSE
jgi:hypothetical protein